MSKLALCDLDGTLVNTDKINSMSYIEAANILGIELSPKILSLSRITKDEILVCQPELTEYVDKLQELKQQLFLRSLDKIDMNNKLLKAIQSDFDYVIIWTAADLGRAMAICKELELTNAELLQKPERIADLGIAIISIVNKYQIDISDIDFYDDNPTWIAKAKEFSIRTHLVSL